MKLLEEVHEAICFGFAFDLAEKWRKRALKQVYDVLLSCVETYEWVSPGATGLLRLWMLQVPALRMPFSALYKDYT